MKQNGEVYVCFPLVKKTPDFGSLFTVGIIENVIISCSFLQKFQNEKKSKLFHEYL